MIRRPLLSELLSALRAEGAVAISDADADAILRSAPQGSPWYARVLAGMSAWMSASFIACGLTCFDLDLSALYVVLGAVLLGVSIAGRRVLAASRSSHPAWDFGVQAALIGTLVARGLLFWGLIDWWVDDGVVALAMCAIEVGVLATYPDRLQGFGTTVLAFAWLQFGLSDLGISTAALPAVAAAVGCGLLWLRRSLPRDRFDREAMHPAGYAALAFALVMGTAEASEHLWTSVALVGIAAALVGAIALENARDVQGGFPLKKALGCLAVLGLGALTVSSPGLVLSVAVGILAFHRRDLLLFGCAVVALSITLTHFYYDLNLSLSAKGLLLIGTGVTLWALSRIPAAWAEPAEVRA